MLTAEEVAQIMKTSIKTVRGWVQSGELARVPIGKREYRIVRRDLNDFIAKRRQQGTVSSNEIGNIWNLLEQIILAPHDYKNGGAWRICLPDLTSEEKRMVLYNCKIHEIIVIYSWHVYCIPQIIGEALVEVSFGNGKLVNELNYKIDLNWSDYKFVGFP